jgi:hypothetical protein
MSVEKAFAIHAAPAVIFAALERDLAEAEQQGGSFEVVRRETPRRLELRVTIGGFPCWLTYTLTPTEDYTEVAARVIPFGIKYTLFRIMTLGLHDGGLAVALVQGLTNLKEAVEGVPSA